MFKGKDDEPIVEETTFGWVIHGGSYPVNERLYSLDVLGIEDRKKNDQNLQRTSQGKVTGGTK